MTPRPSTPDPSPVDDALALARQGAAAEALARLHALPHHDADTGVVAAGLVQVSRFAAAAADRATAEQAIDLALRLAPKFPDLHFQHACLLLESGRRPEARKALNAALK